MNVVFLGTGTSHGVPVVGCTCSVCHSADPKDQRYRASILLRGDEGENVLVDAGPEFRLQALRARVDHLDAVFITHAHADHIHGLDDVRPFTHGRSLPVWSNLGTSDELRVRFAYAFNPPQKGGGVPKIQLAVIPSAGVRVGSLFVRPIPVLHGILEILGYRVGSFAYLTDCSGIPDASLPLLQGVKTLVIDGLRKTPHPTHFSIAQAAQAARSIGAREAWIIHLCHESFHAELEAYCETLSGGGLTLRPAWDGLELDIGGGGNAAECRTPDS